MGGFSRGARARIAVAGLLALQVGPVGVASAETAWIAGGQQVNVRRAPDVDARVLGYAAPAERVEVLETSGGWSHVKTNDGTEGWVASSRIQTDPPPAARAAAMTQEIEELRTKLVKEGDASKQLRAKVDSSDAKAREQQAEIDRLLAAQQSVHREARNREWLTGAGILLAGMALGAILSRMGGRRAGPQRLRL
ncbi:TIGR04211 family SH3 domain-containing protein [bacterium]|nr:TIGR04211 family SH3 domain-containing protein [bacterium]